MMGVLIPIYWTQASIILGSLYPPFYFYEKVGSLMDCPFRRFKRAHDLYEGKSSTPLERTHSNERRSDVLNWVSLTNHTNVQWTGNIGVGNPSQSIKGQSLFFGQRRRCQTSKLITKCAVVFDTLFADMFVLGDGCSACANMNLDLYDIGSSTTAVDQHQSITDFFDLGIISGDLVMEDVNVAGFQVSHSAYWSKEGLRSIPSIGSTKNRRGHEHLHFLSNPKLRRERPCRFRT